MKEDTRTYSSDETLSDRADPERPVSSRYRPLGVTLGRGGLGVVELMQDRDLGREVARKELLSDGPAQRERFLREARITAQLEHPGIVPVYELGQGQDGRPFYTMRRIRGRTLGAVLAECKTEKDRLALLPAFVAACQAVAYAHSHGVLHRDLKPDNMMIGEFGEMLVVDWGLAKAKDDTQVQTRLTGAYPTLMAEGGHLTRLGAAMGTPAYMSPEQARGEAADARSDVWSLGVILYEILAGRRLLDTGTGDEMIQRLQSHKFGSIDAALRGAPPELIAVVKRALEPWAKRRYPDAGALAAELVRWQNGGLVDAYRYSFGEMVVRMVRRNWGIVGVLLIGVVAVALLVTGAVLSYLGIVAERDRAIAAESVAAQRETEANHRVARGMSEAAADALKGGDRLSARVLALGSLAILESPEARGALVATAGELPEIAGALHLAGACDLPTMGPGGQFACWTRDGVVMWPKLVAAPSTVQVPGPVGNTWDMAGSPSGRRYLAVHYDGNAYVLERGVPEPKHLDADAVNAGVFLDEDRVALATGNHLVTIDLRTGAKQASKREAVVRYDAFSVLGDGTVLVGSVVDPLQRWDPRTDRWTPIPGGGLAPLVSASLDGKTMVTAGGWGGSATPLHLSDHGRSLDLEGSVARTAIGVSEDGSRVFAATESKVTIWDAPDWEIRAVIPSDSLILGASMSADGATALVSESDGDIRQWRLPPKAAHRARDSGGTMWDVDPTPDGKLLVSAGNDGVLRVSAIPSGEVLRSIALDPGGLGFLTTDGHDAIVATNTRGLVRISADDLTIRWSLPSDWVANDVQRTGDGDFIVGTTEGDVLRVSKDGQQKWRKKVATWVSSVGITTDGAILAAGQEEIIRLDVADGRDLGHLPSEAAEMVAPAADGTSWLGTLGHVSHLDAKGKVLEKLDGKHETRVHLVAVREDGVVASADDVGRICLWKQAIPQACWPGHRGTVWGVAFVPGTEMLATSGADGAARLWDLSALTAEIPALLDDARLRHGLVPGDGKVLEVVP